MASKQEQAAGIVEAWAAGHGSRDVMGVTDDLVNILRFCHGYRDQPGKAPHFADELAETIADYLIDVYGPEPKSFDDEKDEADA